MFQFLIVALVFYVLGRYTGRERQTLEQASEAIKQFQNRHNRVPAGVITMPTPTELKRTGTADEKTENAIVAAWKKAGL